MPYIKQIQRTQYNDDGFGQMPVPGNAGELNYVLTTIVLDYLKFRGESYQTYCDIEGVLSHMSKEIYRRRVAPYEDEKIKENGDLPNF